MLTSTQAIKHLARGGDWRIAAPLCGSATRLYENQSIHKYHSVGLRVVASVDAVKDLLARAKPIASKPQPTAESPIDYAAERKAAEWVLGTGGSAVVNAIDKMGKSRGEFRRVADLPVEEFALTKAWFGGEHVTSLLQLQHCKQLDYLVANNTGIGDDDLKMLFHFSKLSHLGLGKTNAPTSGYLLTERNTPPRPSGIREPDARTKYAKNSLKNSP